MTPNAACQLRADSVRATGTTPTDPQLNAADPNGPADYPASPVQEALWLAEELHAGAAAAPTVHTIRIAGPLTVSALERALNETARRHEILRTNLTSVDGRPVQRVAAERTYALPVTHVGIENAPNLAAAVQQHVESHLSAPFDLAAGPLLRPALLRIDSLQHLLLLAAHPAIIDRTSIGRVIQELAEFYGAFATETPPPALPAPLQFGPEAGRLHAIAESPDAARAIDFWRTRLDGVEPALDLPYDFPATGKPTATVPSARVELTLSPELACALQDFALREQVTADHLWLAAFHTLLHRWTQQGDTVVGWLPSTELAADPVRAIGPLANPQPSRATFTANPSFREFLRSVQSESVSAGSLPTLTIEQLATTLRPGHTAERNPLVHVLLEMRPPPPELESAGAHFLVVDLPPPRSRYDLALTITPHATAPRLALDYHRERFLPETAQRFLRSFETLLQGIVAQPADAIGALPVIPAAELHQLLVDWNDNALPFHRDLCLHELFERQARAKPDAVAVVGETERVTYAQLNDSAERLAAVLRSHGVEADSLVGVYLQRTPRLLTGILGVLKADAAYVPLDPNYPPDRVRFIMEDTRMRVLVTESTLVDDSIPSDITVICLDQLPPPATASAFPARRRASPQSLAYIIYTSGSTGKPKGVCLPHHAVLAFVAWAEALYSVQELSGVFFATSACFDVSVFEALAPLCLGGKIIIGRNLLEVGTHPARAELTLVSGVPSAMAEVVRTRALPINVRTVNVAGEPCPQALVDDLYALGHIERVYDLYGPTETTVYSVSGLRRPGARASIGRPMNNERVYLLDARQQPVPQGARGELYIGGEKLARGYLHRPDLTAEKFLEVACLPGQRLYRTGDAVRWLPDGTLEYLGRLDRQVKIRGFRVEPGEVEAVLRQHPAVQECAVVPRDDGAGAKMLVAYVVRRDASSDVDAWRRFLEDRLPEYLVPTSFVPLPSLPKSPNGKLDVRALPAPHAQPARSHEYTPPRDAVQQQLVRVWEDVLGVKPIGIHDRFVDLGGHSLMAVRMAAQVERKFGRRLPLSILFRAPTIEKLAAAIRTEGLISSRSSLVEIQPEGIKPPIFWLHTLGGGNGAGLFRYEKLARRLGADQPSYGLVAPPGEQPPTFEAMAEFYLREIRAVQPRGPYHVGGYCFGGVLAYEVARQLEAAGEKVTVIMLDALPPNAPGLPGKFSLAFASHLSRALVPWLVQGLKDPHGFAWRAGKLIQRTLRRGRGILPTTNAPTSNNGEELGDFIDMSQYPAEFRAHAAAHWRAMKAYHPGQFGGRIILLHTKKTMLLNYSPAYQWRQLAQDVVVDIVPGNHADLLEEPQVTAVAQTIASRLP